VCYVAESDSPSVHGMAYDGDVLACVVSDFICKTKIDR